MRESRFTKAVPVILALATAASFLLLNTSAPSWEHEVLDNESYGKFVDVETYDGKTGIAYVQSPEDGLVFLEKQQGYWDRQVVDSRAGAGMYVDMDVSGGKPRIAYQDGTIGNEKLRYAYRNSTWRAKTVDNVSNGGVSVGMYPSLSFRNQEPVIFYHSPSQGLKLAERSQDWDTKVLENNRGWYTDSYTCNNTVKTYYRPRNKTSLIKGTYDGEWKSKDTRKEVKSDLAVTGQNCNEHLTYLDAESNQITYPSGGTKKVFSNAFFSRMSSVHEEKLHILFHEPGTGLTYSTTENGTWNTEIINNRTDAGIYNDIAVDRKGNVHTIYTNKNNLTYSKFNSGQVEEQKTVNQVVRIILVSLTAASIIAAAAVSS